MATVDQLNFNATGLKTIKNKQLRLWASANGTPTKYIYTIMEGVSALPTDAESVFYTGGDMIEGDALATRIKNVLGFTEEQWQLAMQAMLEYPR